MSQLIIFHTDKYEQNHYSVTYHFRLHYMKVLIAKKHPTVYKNNQWGYVI
jgi:hypothetical protein